MRRFVDIVRLDQDVLVNHEFLVIELAKEAARITLVARRSGLLDEQQDAVRIAIDSNLGDLLTMPALFPLSPQTISRSAEVGCEAAGYSLDIGLAIHPCEHQNLMRCDVLCDSW